MRIVLDLQGAQGTNRARGIGRYSLAAAHALAGIVAASAGEHELVVLLSGLVPTIAEKLGQELGRTPGVTAVRVWDGPRPVRGLEPGNEWRRGAAELLRAAAIDALAPDAVIVTDAFGGYRDDTVFSVPSGDEGPRTFVVLYDLIPLRDPSSYLDADSRFRAHYLGRLEELRRATGLLAISQFTADEARHRFGDSVAIENVGAAADEGFQAAGKMPGAGTVIRERYGLASRFVLASGGADPRKNVERLVRAFAGLPAAVRSGVQLVVTGAFLPEQASALDRLAIEAGCPPGTLRLLGFVPDDDLPGLYAACDLFVFPSISEGFGLPALEAMASGAPVIGSNATSIPEVIGWPEALFDPLDVEAMRQLIERGLTDDAFRGELVRRGAEQAARFTWRATAERMLAAVERASGAGSAGRAATPSADELVDRLIEAIRTLSGDPTDHDLLTVARAIDRNHPAVPPA